MTTTDTDTTAPWKKKTIDEWFDMAQDDAINTASQLEDISRLIRNLSRMGTEDASDAYVLCQQIAALKLTVFMATERMENKLRQKLGY